MNPNDLPDIPKKVAQFSQKNNNYLGIEFQENLKKYNNINPVLYKPELTEKPILKDKILADNTMIPSHLLPSNMEYN